MFLRSQLVCRLPATSIRLYRNSVPSTSIATPYLPAIVLSRCHLHIMATSSPQLARHFEVKGARTKHTDDSNSSSNKGGPEPIKPTGSNERQRTALLMRLIGGLAFAGAISWFLVLSAVKPGPLPDGLIPADAPHVDYATFIKKYLRAGEIQKITFKRHHRTAVATLHAGAIVDGKQTKSDSIVINCPYRPANELRRDVRKVEAEMGISRAHGVDIKLISVVPRWKLYIVFGGIAILTVLMVRDGRSLFLLGMLHMKGVR